MDDLVAIIAILSVFGSITAVFTLPAYLKYRTQTETQKTVRTAIAQGQPLPDVLIDVMTRDVRRRLPTRSRDIRRGVQFIAIGIGLALVGQFTSIGAGFIDDRMLSNGLLGIACLPVTMGIAFLILAYLNKDKD